MCICVCVPYKSLTWHVCGSHQVIYKVTTKILRMTDINERSSFSSGDGDQVVLCGQYAFMLACAHAS